MFLLFSIGVIYFNDHTFSFINFGASQTLSFLKLKEEKEETTVAIRWQEMDEKLER